MRKLDDEYYSDLIKGTTDHDYPKNGVYPDPKGSDDYEVLVMPRISSGPSVAQRGPSRLFRLKKYLRNSTDIYPDVDLKRLGTKMLKHLVKDFVLKRTISISRGKLGKSGRLDREAVFSLMGGFTPRSDPNKQLPTVALNIELWLAYILVHYDLFCIEDLPLKLADPISGPVAKSLLEVIE
jgi:hypothetical protein